MCTLADLNFNLKLSTKLSTKEDLKAYDGINYFLDLRLAPHARALQLVLYIDINFITILATTIIRGTVASINLAICPLPSRPPTALALIDHSEHTLIDLISHKKNILSTSLRSLCCYLFCMNTMGLVIRKANA